MILSPYEGVQRTDHHDDMRAKSAENAFAARGFQNWKLIATTVCRQHELGAFNRDAVESVIALPEAQLTDISECSS